ncbi:MAG: aldo/keto reductase [Candidatus Sumerlaeia bacterium]
MEYIRFGRTDLQVSRTSFGALPIQRVSFDEARALMRRAFEGGVNLYDTARGYSDSEEKIGYGMSDIRDEIIIATKSSGANDRKGVMERLEVSLKNMKTDHVDILQLHNPKQLPDPDDPESAYAGLLEAQKKGMTRFIGITAHALQNAIDAANSGLYDTIQFPLSAISTPEEFALADLCKEKDLGLLAMKAMCGGILDNGRMAFAGLRRYENIVPIWGIQRMSEIDEFLELEENPPEMDAIIEKQIEAAREELSGAFCRGCGYCLPCPADIPIPLAARMTYLLNRAPWQNFVTEEWQEKMQRIEQCKECGQCIVRCPYDLDTPNILKRMLAGYEEFVQAHA